MNMNEMDRVRTLLSEPPPPSDEAAAKALTMLEDAMAPGGRRVRAARRRFGWPAGLGAGLVAAGAAAAVAVVASGGQGSPGSPGSPEGPPVDLNRKAVLAAAAKAELMPTGTYWYTDSVDGQSYVIRAKTGTYAITAASSESFAWTGAKPGMGEAHYARDLPARPASARDAALWREAGSPSTFRVRGDGRTITYTTAKAKWRSNGPEVGANPDGGGTFVGPGPGPATLEDLRKLPADPARLAELFLRPGAGNPAGADPSGRVGKKAEPGPQNAYAQIWRTASVLGGPLPPKVRAGLMRALAGQSGVHAIGRATDPLGRSGVALATADRARAGYRSRDVIIFDEGTGALLAVQSELTRPGGEYAEMKPGFVTNYQLDRASGWTNSKPRPPAELPF